MCYESKQIPDVINRFIYLLIKLKRLVVFQVNSWLTWLESMSSEDEDDEDAWILAVLLMSMKIEQPLNFYNTQIIVV